MERLASIDIGTHSTRILIGEVENGSITEIERHTNITKLGEGISGRMILGSALSRVSKVLISYSGLLNKYDVSKVTVFTTSAVRDAENKEEFSLAVEKAVGVKPRVISGQEEASLTFKGVCSALSNQKNPILVIDIGGGSTEFAYGHCWDSPAAVSLNIGCLRLKEAYIKQVPPLAGDVRLLSEFVRDTINKAGMDYPQNVQTYAVAGTATSLMAIKLGLEPYDRSKVHMQKLFIEDVSDLEDKLTPLNIEELKILPGLQPDRAEVILSGVLILRQIMEIFELPYVTVSEHDILDGSLLKLSTQGLP